jgi:hypothetical protein
MAGVALLAVVLAACSTEPESAEVGVKWEEAKASAQSTAREIIALIPQEDVVVVGQNATGTLFSCDDTRHRWHGTATVEITSGIDLDSAIKNVERQLNGVLDVRGEFAVANRLEFFGDYAVTAKSATTQEAYLLGHWEANSIIIDSWSECFTLPEGTYLGGDF